MTRPHLFVGNKNYSSWSLRPWLALRWAGVDFDETLIPLGGIGYGQGTMPAVLAVSPTGKVPAMSLGDVVIADSLAICEWAAEQAPSSSPLLPTDSLSRALCRSAMAEMHSGFACVRRDLPMNIKRRVTTTPKFPKETQVELERLWQLWSSLRQRFAHAGPWLLGQRSLADAFFAPVATRLRTYGVAAPSHLQSWCDTLLNDADFQAWEQASVAEAWTNDIIEALYR
jgi:glutathione S-transferase